MVKGFARHIIVVKNPDNKNFEQAIFVVKGELFRKSGKSEFEIMAEARAAAESYIKNTFKKSKRGKDNCVTY